VEMSVSLDGDVGPDVDVGLPSVEGGDRLHDWMFSGRRREETEAFEVESLVTTGALVMSRRVFNVGVGPWGANPDFQESPARILLRRRERIDVVVSRGARCRQ
jgi:hypothetical protein